MMIKVIACSNWKNLKLTGLVMALLLIAVTTASCGSTKVITADKTIVYRGTLYNVSNVKKMSSRIEATLPDASKVNMKNLDRDAKRQLFRDNEEMRVTMAIDLDQESLIYLNTNMDSYSDYSRVEKRFENALEDIGDFMSDKKDTQLELK